MIVLKLCHTCIATFEFRQHSVNLFCEMIETMRIIELVAHFKMPYTALINDP